MEINSLVSVVIPCYNDAQYVEQSVYSALNQTYTNIEVIVVDDGSNIETKAVLKKIEPYIAKLITQENKGQSSARNIGIQYAKGVYIFVLDSDDYIEKYLIKKAVKIMTINQNIKLVSANVNMIYNNYKKPEKFYPKGGCVLDCMFTSNVIGGVMFRKFEWYNVGGYDENMTNGIEDREFYIRLLKNGGEVKVIPEFLFNYRIKENSTSTRANKNKYEILKYIFFKHKDLYKFHFDKTMIYILDTAAKNRLEEQKRINSIDYKIGSFILKPIRYIKSLIAKFYK